MNIRAKTNPMYLGKFLLIGLFATGFGLYHLYDAVFKFPSMIPVAELYESFDTDEISDGDLQRKWEQLTTEKGWPTETPHPSAELRYFINYNYFIGAIFTFLIGLPCLIMALINLGGWFEADDEGLSNRKGQKVKFDQITKIDKTKWEKKGITKLHYDDNGTSKQFIIDDLKFDRESADQIMQLVEEKVGTDKIDGGISEAAFLKEKEEAAAEKRARDEEEMANMEE